jgi:predicted nuclease of predicted toxin-antitoxin system
LPHRLYTNENFPRQAAERLRQLGHDVVTVLEDGLANQNTPDPKVLARATALNRAVVTMNRQDFIRLHADVESHAGIIVCRAEADPLSLAKRVHDQIDPQPTLTNQLIRIQRA